MKIVIAGGSGYLGTCVASYYSARGGEVVILSRTARQNSGNIRTVVWDGKTSGPWVHELEGSDLIINLTGKSVDCRYNDRNKREILDSRVDSVLALGEAIRALKRPPSCWIQSSSATIYRHAEDRSQDEKTGELGEGFSVDVCRAWESAFNQLVLPDTRKIIIRTGIVLGQGGGALPTLVQLCRLGFGGQAGSGKQYVTWIHEGDFVKIVNWLFSNQSATGIYNCTAPWPIPNRQFMKKLSSLTAPMFRFPTPEWMLRIGSVVIRTEAELVLKSRWVKPGRLLDEGYVFRYPRIGQALEHLFAKGAGNS